MINFSIINIRIINISIFIVFVFALSSDETSFGMIDSSSEGRVDEY